MKIQNYIIHSLFYQFLNLVLLFFQICYVKSIELQQQVISVKTQNVIQIMIELQQMH